MIAPSVHSRVVDSHATRGRLRTWQAFLLILVLNLACYAPALTAGFIWDDDDYVENNLTLRTLDGLRQIWFEPITLPQYYPLVHTTFWVEYQLWGLQPFGYHLDNVLLHTLSAGLIGIFLKRLSVPGAWLAACIFAVHPVQVESVAWVTERKNVLSASLCFASAICMWDWFSSDRKRWPAYVVALLLFAFALTAKTVTCSLPAVLLVLLWWKRGVTRRDVVTLVPFFVIGFTLAMVTATFEHRLVGARGLDFQISFVDRILIANRAIWFYLGKLVWPVQLSFIYPRWDVPIHARAWVTVLATFTLMCGLWLTRTRFGRAGLAALVIFVGILFPALGFINVYPMRFSFVADHFQYLASGAVIAVSACLLTRAVGRAAIVVVPMLMVVTALRAGVYHDRLTLWTDTREKNPHSWVTLVNLGLELSKRSTDKRNAIAQYEEAMHTSPNIPDTHFHLGTAYAAIDRNDEARQAFDRALQIDPTFAPAYVSLGRLQIAQGSLGEAEALFRKAIAVNRYTFAAWSGLAVVQDRQGRRPEAMSTYAGLLEIEPNNLQAMFDLGRWAMEANDLSAARAWLSRVASLQPDWPEAQVNLGACLLKMGDPDGASERFQKALAIRPGFAPALRGLTMTRRATPETTR